MPLRKRLCQLDIVSSSSFTMTDLETHLSPLSHFQQQFRSQSELFYYLFVDFAIETQPLKMDDIAGSAVSKW